MPKDFVGKGEGLIYACVNETDSPIQCEYACVTAPSVIECAVTIDGELVDLVYAGNGGSHSWWTAAGGRLMCRPLPPGGTLEVRLSGPGAFRIDWYN